MVKCVFSGLVLQPATPSFQCAARLPAYPVSHHTPSKRASAAAGFVSSLAKGAAHAGRCVRLAGAWVVVGFIHGCSVVEHSLTGNGVLFSKVDIWN